MKIGSLFSGIGGFELGLERSGMEIVWQVENDEYAKRVLERHWPHAKRFTDVREVGFKNLAAVDLVCGGFPCQPHSLAGKRKASGDERDLWGEFARIIREIKPRWVVAENVRGLLSSESGQFFGRILRDLASSGYDAEWDCLPAAAFGAPHERDRVFIIAYPDSTTGRVQSVQQQECENPSGLRNDGAKESLANAQGLRERDLSARSRREGEGEINSSRIGEDVAHSHGTGCREQWRPKSVQSKFDASQCSRDDVPNATHNGIGRREQQSEGREGKRGMADTRRVFRGRPLRERIDEITGSGWWDIEPDVGRVVDGVSSFMDRLGGIPIESAPPITNPKKIKAGRSHRLRGLGNAVVPAVTEWIGEQIMKYERGIHGTM